MRLQKRLTMLMTPRSMVCSLLSGSQSLTRLRIPCSPLQFTQKLPNEATSGALTTFLSSMSVQISPLLSSIFGLRHLSSANRCPCWPVGSRPERPPLTSRALAMRPLLPEWLLLIHSILNSMLSCMKLCPPVWEKCWSTQSASHKGCSLVVLSTSLLQLFFASLLIAIPSRGSAWQIKLGSQYSLAML